MHELGVLCHVVKTVSGAASKHHIQSIKYITLEVGVESGYLPHFLKKLFPVAVAQYPEIGNPELRLIDTPGRKLEIKEFGYS